MVEDLLARIRGGLPRSATVVVAAPGRINVIGEHTDYIDGLALPAAIDRHIVIGLHDRSGPIRIDSLDAADSTEVDPTVPIRALPPETPDWVRYMVGSIAVFVDHVAGPNAPPARLMAPFHAAVTGDVPRGAGLSSSAALTVAWMNALSAWSGHSLDDVTVVALARKVEHDWLGVACGALDQTASQLGRSGHLLRVDFRTMAVAPIAVQVPHTWLVLDTAVRRGLAHSAYTDRVNAVTTGLRQLAELHSDVQHWRDLRPEHLSGLSDPVQTQRLRHGISENARVDQMVRALGSGDLSEAGALLDASHHSLQVDYAVSCVELDAMAALARSTPGIFGARMVGAGFGGCALALADADIATAALDGLLTRYQQATGRSGAIHRVQPARGAHRIA